MALLMRSLADTARLGRWLGQNLSVPNPPALFLRGPLGCGKTALVRFLVASLPGSENAEVNSPSFTICNYYPTRPPVLHCDLYRCRSDIPEEIFEAMPARLVLVEWAEYFPRKELPKDYLDIRFNMDNDNRLLVVNGAGAFAKNLQNALAAYWQASNSAPDKE